MNEALHFSIEGLWLSNFSRERLQEGDYQHALRILDCLDGMQFEDKISILKGEKDLTGTNELDIVDAPEKTKRYMKEWYQEKYSKILKWNNRYYEPYMLVQSWNHLDLPNDNSYFSPLAKKFTEQFEPKIYDKMDTMFGGNKLNGLPHSRSLYYADNPRDDIAFSINLSDLKSIRNNTIKNDGVVIFKELREQMPFWVDDIFSITPLGSIINALKYNCYFKKDGAEFHTDSDDYSNNLFKIKNPLVKADNSKYFENIIEDYDDNIINLQQRIKEFADNDKEYGWKTFIDENNNMIKVPGLAFMHFALKKGQYSDNEFSNIILPEYLPISQSGLKMINDDPLHSDCWIGAGLDIDKAYDIDSWENSLFFKNLWKTQFDIFDGDFNIIAKGSENIINGTTVNTKNYESVPKGQRILVIPNLNVNFETAFFQCDHVICETGGKLAHLSTLAREFNKTIIRIDDATLKYIRTIDIKIDLVNLNIEEIKHTNEKRKKL
jgi:hypothetical protein